MHYLYGGIRLQVARDRLSGAAQVQLSVLLGLFVLAKAADYWLDRFDLVTSSGSLFTGMSYTDDNAVLPGQEHPDRHRADLRGAVLPQRLAPHLAAAVGGPRPAGAVRDPARPDLAGHRAAVPGQARRGRQGGAVHREEHRGHPGGVRPRRHRESAATPAHQHRGRRRSTSSTRRPRRCRWSTRSWSARPSSSSSRCAPTTRCAPVLDVDRYEIDGTDRALVLGVRELDQNGIGRQRPATGPTCTPSTPTATASSRPTPTSAPRTTSEQSGTDPVGRGPGGQPERADRPEPRTATRRASTSASRARTTRSSARTATARPSSSTCRKGERDDENQTTTLRRRRRRADRQPRSTSCSTP